jgi:hypothetical protein
MPLLNTPIAREDNVGDSLRESPLVPLLQRGKHGFLLPLAKGDREGFQERYEKRVLGRRSLPFNILPPLLCRDEGEGD